MSPARLPDSEHTKRPWRVHGLTTDFRLQDVWALPTPGGPGDFPQLLQLLASGGLSSASRASRGLWAIRLKLGALLGWDELDGGPELERPTLRDRLPAELRDTSAAAGVEVHPFRTLYMTDDEWAGEIVNRTVHGVLHVGWVREPAGDYRGQMAVLVKPNGLLGHCYMAAIGPFRHLIVYPAMLRAIGTAWRARAGRAAPARAHP